MVCLWLSSIMDLDGNGVAMILVRWPAASLWASDYAFTALQDYFREPNSSVHFGSYIPLQSLSHCSDASLPNAKAERLQWWNGLTELLMISGSFYKTVSKSRLSWWEGNVYMGSSVSRDATSSRSEGGMEHDWVGGAVISGIMAASRGKSQVYFSA